MDYSIKVGYCRNKNVSWYCQCVIRSYWEAPIQYGTFSFHVWFFCVIVVPILPQTEALWCGGKWGGRGKWLLTTQCLGVACSFYLHTFGLRPLKRNLVFCPGQKCTCQIVRVFWIISIFLLSFTLQWKTGVSVNVKPWPWRVGQRERNLRQFISWGSAVFSIFYPFLISCKVSRKYMCKGHICYILVYRCCLAAYFLKWLQSFAMNLNLPNHTHLFKDGILYKLFWHKITCKFLSLWDVDMQDTTYVPIQDKNNY